MPVKPPAVISAFRGQYSFLSNFYRHPIVLDGRVYPSTEHYYQASKAAFTHAHEAIRNAPTPAEAKHLAWEQAARAGFDDDKELIMETALRAKFEAGTPMARRLIETGDAELIEGNTWHDNFWGDCSCGKRQKCAKPGRNMLGQLLMKIRKELQEGTMVDPTGEGVDQNPFVITLTGHRDASEPVLRPVLRNKLIELKSLHPRLSGRCGMAAGADIIFGELLVELGISFDAFIPDHGYFDRYVPLAWKQRHNDLLAKASTVIYCAQQHDWKNNFLRNDMMISGVDLIYAAYRYDDIDQFRATYRPRKGGTAACIMSALRQGFVIGQNLIQLPC